MDYESAKTKSLKASRRAVDAQLNGKLSFTKRHRLSGRLEQIDRDLYQSQQQDDRRQLEVEIKNRKQADKRLKDISRDPNHIDPQRGVGRLKNHFESHSHQYVCQEIDGVMFSDHAIQRMRERGVHASLVLQAISTTTPKGSRGNLTFYDKANKLFVVTDIDGTIVTVEFKTILDW